MLEIVLWVSLALIAGVVQSTVMPSLSIAGSSPNLVLLLTVSCAALAGLHRGLLVALVGGLVLDGLSGAPFGLATVSLGATSVLAAVSGRNIFQKAWFLPYLAIGLATILYTGLYFGLLSLGGALALGFYHVWRLLIPQILFNILAIPLVYKVLSSFWHRPKHLEDSW